MSKFLLFFLASATLQAAEYKEILLSECNQYPNVTKEMIRYRNNGPSLYGSWYFDLYYSKVREILLVDAFDKPMCEKPIQRKENMKGPHFELPENHGNASQVLKDVMAFLAAHEADACAPKP